jgi:glyoxylase-like metal-dependent hydrolase (beta-lactamase superfamily II)
MSPGSGVHCLTLSGMVNVYLVEHAAGWALIDTGCSFHFGAILRAARERFGEKPPTGLFLTHGHMDHAGSAKALADHWDVPVFASERELPFLDGRCDYPPGDPGVGGPGGFFAHFGSTKGFDLGARLKPLAPGSLPGWESIPLPGHTPGQVGYWRESDRTLLAGDALTTRELNSWKHLLRGEGKLGMPPASFTMDWFGVRKSVIKIGELAPAYLGAGHGQPLAGDELKRKLDSFLEYATIARKGRYVAQPVRQRDDGTLTVPSVPPDPVQKAVSLAVLATAALGAGWWLWTLRKN